MSRKITTLAFLCLIGQLIAVAPQADGQEVLLSIENLQIDISDNSQSHTFDVILTSADPVELTGFQASLDLFGLSPNAPDARFTEVSAPTSRDYVLAPNSASPIGQISNSLDNVQIGDFLLSNFASAQSGSALASITIELDGGVQAGDSYSIAFDTDPNATFLVGNDNNNFLDITTVDGQFATTVIPEPTSSALVGFFIAAFCVRRRRRE